MLTCKQPNGLLRSATGATRVRTILVALASITISMPGISAAQTELDGPDRFQQCEPDWAGGFEGLGIVGPLQQVVALTVFDDGSGPALRAPTLYAGGWFTTAGGAIAKNIAQWDGSAWSALGSGVNQPVSDLIVFDDGSGPALYVGGNFTIAGGADANHIAKWDGSSWSAVGDGMDETVFALAVFDDGSGSALYAGGIFTTAGGAGASYIAKWDGSKWSSVGGGTDGHLLALMAFDDGSGPALYAGGSFSTAGGVEVNNIAKWDGATWSALDSGVETSGVSALTVFDDGSGPALYAGGQFSHAGGGPARSIAKWDGLSWSALGTGMIGRVIALTVFDDGSGPALYAGGSFIHADGVKVNSIAKWDGATWSGLDSGMEPGQGSADVQALAVFDDGSGPALYTGGEFATAGGVPVNNIAKWNGATWSALESMPGSGVEDTVRALTVFDDGFGGGPALYVGGSFNITGGLIVNSIAKWDGATWSTLGSGTNGAGAMTVFDDGFGPALYVGTGSRTGDGTIVNHIARWNGLKWSALGTGMDDRVSALTGFDAGGALYAGGEFTTAGGLSANRIAQWDGSKWSALGSGMDGGRRPRVFALVVFDDGTGPALYAGGEFELAGGVPVNNIAKWNGSTWSALGSGVAGRVQGLVVFDDGTGPALYVGGGFSVSTAGGVRANHIAKWNGSTWSPLGDGMSSNPRPLTVFDDGCGSGPALYAGGDFRYADGVKVNYIAKWDGVTWSPLGSGMNSILFALTVFDDGSGCGPSLYAGGSFTTAGGKVSTHIARWDTSETDTDGDSLADCLDNCPNHFNPDQADCDADGIGDFCAIADGISRDVFPPGHAPDGIPDDCQTRSLTPDKRNDISK